MDRYCTRGLSLLFQRVKSPARLSIPWPPNCYSAQKRRLLQCCQSRQNEPFGNVENKALQTIIHLHFLIHVQTSNHIEPWYTCLGEQNRWFSSNWYGKFANLLESWHPNKNEEQTRALPSHLFTPSILTPRLPMGRDAGAVRQVFQQHDTTRPQNRCCSDQWTSAKQTQIQRGSLQPAFLRLQCFTYLWWPILSQLHPIFTARPVDFALASTFRRAPQILKCSTQVVGYVTCPFSFLFFCFDYNYYCYLILHIIYYSTI